MSWNGRIACSFHSLHGEKERQTFDTVGDRAFHTESQSFVKMKKEEEKNIDQISNGQKIFIQRVGFYLILAVLHQ